MRRWECGGLEPVGARDHARGPEDAPVTLVMYGDYECPYCGELHPVLKELQQRVGERVRFVFRHFPLDSAHPRARRAALTAEAAASQDRFWEMHDLLYENQDQLGDEDLMRYAAELELDLGRFEEDLANDDHAWRIEEDRLGGERAGVGGTPAFFVNGVRYTGPMDLDGLLVFRLLNDYCGRCGRCISEPRCAVLLRVSLCRGNTYARGQRLHPPLQGHRRQSRALPRTDLPTRRRT
jgi:2-hydroxychromene-2-carboxylate isomerase